MVGRVFIKKGNVHWRRYHKAVVAASSSFGFKMFFVILLIFFVVKNFLKIKNSVFDKIELLIPLCENLIFLVM